MYKLKHASEVPIRGNVIRTGLPAYEHTIPNIAIVSVNNMEPLHLNAAMLRTALLNSPEEVERFLGLVISDATTKPAPKKSSKPKEPKKKVETEVTEPSTSKESEEVNEWM